MALYVAMGSDRVRVLVTVPDDLLREISRPEDLRRLEEFLRELEEEERYQRR